MNYFVLHETARELLLNQISTGFGSRLFSTPIFADWDTSSSVFSMTRVLFARLGGQKSTSLNTCQIVGQIPSHSNPLMTSCALASFKYTSPKPLVILRNNSDHKLDYLLKIHTLIIQVFDHH